MLDLFVMRGGARSRGTEEIFCGLWQMRSVSSRLFYQAPGVFLRFADPALQNFQVLWFRIQETHAYP